MIEWHHQLNGHEFEQTPGDSEGLGSLVCCSTWGHKELDTIEWLTEQHTTIPEWPSPFPYILQFKPEFCSMELIIWATMSSRSCVCWLYRVSPSLAAKNVINLVSVSAVWWCPCVESSLGLLGKAVCMNSVFFWQNCWPLLCFVLYLKAKLACCPGISWFSTLAFSRTFFSFGSSRRSCRSS